MFEKIRGMMAEQLSIDKEEISMESNFREDFDADSLTIMEIALNIEDEFNVEIDEGDMEDISTVSQLCYYIVNKIK